MVLEGYPIESLNTIVYSLFLASPFSLPFLPFFFLSSSTFLVLFRTLGGSQGGFVARYRITGKLASSLMAGFGRSSQFNTSSFCVFFALILLFPHLVWYFFSMYYM